MIITSLHCSLAFLYVILLDNTCLVDYATGCDLRSILWLKMAPSDDNNYFNHQKPHIEIFFDFMVYSLSKRNFFPVLSQQVVEVARRV